MPQRRSVRGPAAPLPRTVLLLLGIPALLLAHGSGPARSAPPPSPAPLSPSWAFDPNGPYLPGADPPAFLLPGWGQPFNPARPNQPQAIRGPRPPVPPCRLIVPARMAALQPLHIPPVQVPLKNRFGCLSPADAIYGPDGCPRQLCGKVRGFQIPLPPGGP